MRLVQDLYHYATTTLLNQYILNPFAHPVPELALRYGGQRPKSSER